MEVFENDRNEEYIKIRKNDLSVNDLIFYIIKTMLSVNKEFWEKDFILNDKLKFKVKIERVYDDR